MSTGMKLIAVAIGIYLARREQKRRIEESKKPKLIVIELRED